MKEIEIRGEKVVIFGVEYPPTQYNLEVWREYCRTRDKSVLERLSDVVLDI